MDFFFKHGPGSVGANAKLLCRFYNHIRDNQPDWSKDEALKEVLRMRIRPPYEQATGISLSEQQIGEMTKKANGSLSELILSLTYIERGEAILGAGAGESVRRVIREIVGEMVPDGDSK